MYTPTLSAYPPITQLHRDISINSQYIKVSDVPGPTKLEVYCVGYSRPRASPSRSEIPLLIFAFYLERRDDNSNSDRSCIHEYGSMHGSGVLALFVV